MDQNDEVEMVYENCSTETLLTTRDVLKNQYMTILQSSGSNSLSIVVDRNRSVASANVEMMQQGGSQVESTCPSSTAAMPASSENTALPTTSTEFDPLAVKMELIDVLDGDVDPSAIEILIDDDDNVSTVSTVTTMCPLSEEALLNDDEASRDDISDIFEGEETMGSGCDSTEFSNTKQQNHHESPSSPSSPTNSDEANQSKRKSVKTTLSAKEIWREVCRSSMSTCSTDSEYQTQLPFFTEAYSTRSVASSFVKDVDHMRLDDLTSTRENTPLPISLDEVTSSSDVLRKKQSDGDRELEMAARWAEPHDLLIDDGDEFLECEDEEPSSSRGVTFKPSETEAQDNSTRKKQTKSTYRCRHHKRSLSRTSRKEKAHADTAEDDLHGLSKEKSTKNLRKRDGSSSVKPTAALPVPRGVVLSITTGLSNYSVPQLTQRRVKTLERLCSSASRVSHNFQVAELETTEENSSPITGQGSDARSRAGERKRFASDRSDTDRRRSDSATRGGQKTPPPPKPLISVPRSTTTTVKAHNLPRYKPVERKYDFTRWLDSNGELVLHKIKDVAVGLVSAPLGCTYDSALDTFVFTRHDSILFASSDGRVLENLTLRGFDRPCAICIIQPGVAIGILDRSNIYLYEPKCKRLNIIASGICNRHRALSYTCNGDLVTVKKFGTQVTLTIYDATKYNRIIGSFLYPETDLVPSDRERKPCFADSTGNQIFFTDLKTNTLTCMEIVGNRFEKVYSHCMQQFPAHRGEEALKRFVYMSGIRCDDSGHLLVADAKTHMLKLLTSSGQLLKCAKVANGASFPFCAAFGVSPSGLLMACDRGNNRMILYRIGEESVSEDAVITNDVFARMIGEHGVEKEVRHLKDKAQQVNGHRP